MTVSLLAGCGLKKQDSKEATKLVSGDIFSNRPQNFKNDLIIVRLQSPALFATASKADQKVIVSEQSKTQVVQEQEAFKKALAQISSEIEVV